MNTMENHLRSMTFDPFNGRGETFTINLYDTNKVDEYGKSILGYSLVMRRKNDNIVIFSGEDYHCSPMHAVDSDASIRVIMGFLTNRSSEEVYTKVQEEFLECYAEYVSYEVSAILGDDD